MAAYDGLVIDGLQYCNWSEQIFRELRQGGVTAIHVTIAYHETFREMVGNIATWNRWFERFPDLIMPGRSAADVQRAKDTNRTAVFFGFQNPSPIEDEIGLVEICHQLGIRFMQLSYNNQSLLATGCYEAEDTGVTRMGREVIQEMNRFGIAIDMSHSAEKSTLQAIELSARPIAITHANPSVWRDVARNKSNAVLRALSASGGMLGFSLYPHHIKDSSDCSLASFCEMAARTAELMGAAHIGIGSDLCQNQPDSVVEWMRTGRWTKHLTGATFPPQPSWFRDNRDFPGIAGGLRRTGFNAGEIAGIMGENWLRFFAQSFEPTQNPPVATKGS